MYHFGGNIPKKNGDWKKWQGIVPSESSKDFWQGYYSSKEVPAYINPETGWIQNANDPPYTSTIPNTIDPKDYPSHIAPNGMSFRPQRSARLIKEAENLTLTDFIELKHDTKAEFALRIKEELKTVNSTFEDSLTGEALKILHKWDGAFDATSNGPVLFSMFVKELGTFGIFETDWSFNDPLNTPRGLKNEAEVLASLKNAAENHLAKYGTLNMAYGKVYQLKVGNLTYDGNGGAGPLGIFRTVDYTSGQDGKYYAAHGETFVCVMEFGEEVKAEALLTYGNATQAHSSHVGDQLKLFAEKKLRKVWLKREEQLKNLEKTEKLSDMQH
jgi:acyl-homoserine-lactone acylase